MAQDVVRCRINVSEFPDNWDMTPSFWESWVVGKLKESGVPVIGTLKFSGIKSGRLRRFDDPADFGTYFYEWTPNSDIEGKP